MKLPYYIKQKGRLVFFLFFFLLIDILSNNSQIHKIKHLNSTINEIHADRLIAQNLIFKISEEINNQKIYLLSETNHDSLLMYMNVSFRHLESLLKDYDKTKLTIEESLALSKLKVKVRALNMYFLKLYNTEYPFYSLKQNYLEQTKGISTILINLSEIQISRSNDLKIDSSNTLSFAGIINDLNWALSFVISLAILFTVLATKSITSKINQQQQLN